MKKIIYYLQIVALIAAISYCVYKGTWYQKQIKLLKATHTEKTFKKLVTINNILYLCSVVRLYTKVEPLFYQ